MALTLHYPFLTNPSLTGHSNLGLASSTPDLSITRATLAWDTDADGYIRRYQSGEARFTGATWADNIFQRTRMDVSPWTLNFSTRTTGQTDSQGGTDAILLEDDGLGGSSNSVQIFQNVALGTELKNGGQYVISIDVKAVSGKTSWLFVAAEGYAPTGTSVWCDPNTGSVGSTGVDNDFEGVTDLGNGWYRFYFAFTLTTDNTGVMRFYLGDSNGDRTIDRDGTHAILLGRPQLETISGTGLTAPRDFLENDTSAIKSSLSGTSTKGLLVEEARTNLQTYSEDSSFWTETGTSVINSNAAVAPDGSNTATILTDDDGAGYEFARLVQPSISTNTTYAFSMFVKKDAIGAATRVTGFRLTFLGGTSQAFDLQIDTSTGDFDAARITGAAGTITGGVIDHSTDYWRFYAIINDGNTANTSFRCDIFPAITSGTVSSADSAAATGSVTVWGAMLEATSAPTSYIPTTATSQTRDQDIVTVADVGFMGDQSEGTFYIKATLDPGHNAGVNNMLVVGQGGASSNSMYISDNGGAARVDHNSAAGNDGLILQNGAIVGGTEFQIATAFQQDELDAYVDGTQFASIGPDATMTCPTTGLFDEISLFDHPDVAGWEFNGIITEVRFYNKFISTELSDLSTGVFPSFGGGRTLTRPLTRDLTRELARAKAGS